MLQSVGAGRRMVLRDGLRLSLAPCHQRTSCDGPGATTVCRSTLLMILTSLCASWHALTAQLAELLSSGTALVGPP